MTEPILDETITPGQSGHIADSDAHARHFNLFRKADGSALHGPADFDRSSTQILVAGTASVVIDPTAASTQYIALSAPSNNGRSCAIAIGAAPSGRSKELRLLFFQDATGGCQVTFLPAPRGFPIAIDTSPNAVTSVLLISSDGVSWTSVAPTAAGTVVETQAVQISASGPTPVLSWGTDYDVTMDQPATFSFVGAQPGVTSRMELVLRGPFLPTFPTEVRWTGTPLTAALQVPFVDVELKTLDGGATIIARQWPGATSAPSAPAFLNANPGNAQAVLNWGAPAQNGGDPSITYTVTVRKHSDGSLVGSVHTGISALTLTVTGLTNGTLYDLSVVAVNGSGSSPADVTQVTPVSSATAPGAVVGLALAPGDTKIVATYGDPISNGGSALTGFSGTVTQSGGGVTTPASVQKVNTNTVTSAGAIPRQWSAWGTSTASHTVSATLPGAPVAGSTLIACLFHTGNSSLVTSAPAGFTRRTFGLDSTGALPDGAGADVWVEIWDKVAVGNETGALTFTLNGPTANFALRVGEVPNLGTFRGAAGVLAGGVYSNQVAWSGTPATTLASGNTPNLTDANTFALGLFMSVDQAVAAFSNSYVELDAGTLTNTHIVTKQISGGTGAPTSTTITDAAMNKCAVLGIWQVTSTIRSITATISAAVAGHLLIATLHESTPGQTASLATNGWSTIHSATDPASGATVYIATKTAVGGETAVTYNLTAGSGGAVLTVEEWSGVGAEATALLPSPVTPGTALALGTTASQPTGSLVMIAATLSVTEAITFPSHSPSYTADVASGVAHVGTVVTTGSGTLGGSLTFGSANGVAVLIVWGPAPSAYTQTLTAAAGVHSIEFDTLTDGIAYSVAVHATNTIGAGPDTTLVATPIAPVTPPSGGVTAVRNALGTQQGKLAYLNSVTSRWTNAAPIGPLPWGQWFTTTCVETDLGVALTDFATPSSPINVYRFGNDPSGGAPWTIAQINAGTHDAAIDAAGVQLHQLTVAQGQAQIIRPLYEGCDQNVAGWMAWNLAGSSNAQWISAFVRIVTRVYAKFTDSAPKPKVDLCMNIGLGGGSFGTGADAPNAHSHTQWDAIVTGIQAAGVVIHYADWDCYSNGPPGGGWLATELAMMAARAVAWSATNPGAVPMQVAHGEWGIGGLGSTVPAAQPPHNWDAVAWTSAFLTWWASLPTSGAGSLGHIDLFDVGPFQGALPDGRGVSFVPDPPANPDGFRVVAAIKTFLA